MATINFYLDLVFKRASGEDENAPGLKSKKRTRTDVPITCVVQGAPQGGRDLRLEENGRHHPGAAGGLHGGRQW